VTGGGEIKVEDDGSINGEGTGRAEQVVVLALKACLLGSFAWGNHCKTLTQSISQGTRPPVFHAH